MSCDRPGRTLKWQYSMNKLNLGPGALHGYVSNSTDDSYLHAATVATRQTLKSFGAHKDLIWGRPTLALSSQNVVLNSNSAKVISSFNDTTAAMTVHLPYYARTSTATLTTSHMTALHSELSTAYQLSVNLVFVRLSSPYLDATILAEYLSRELQGQTFNRVMSSLVSVAGPVDNSTPLTTLTEDSQGLRLPASLVGLQVHLAGRLSKEASRPRMTKQSMTLGSLTTDQSHTISLSSHTTQNKKGSYTIKVWMAHLM